MHCKDCGQFWELCECDEKEAVSECPSVADCSTATETRDLIMRDICESLPADPEHERTVCINYEKLYAIVSSHLLEC